MNEDEEDAQEEARVTYSANNESFFTCICSRVFFKPETDQ